MQSLNWLRLCERLIACWTLFGLIGLHIPESLGMTDFSTGSSVERARKLLHKRIRVSSIVYCLVLVHPSFLEPNGVCYL